MLGKSAPYRLTPEHAARLRAYDEQWIRVLLRFGFTVTREADGWVTYDGNGTIAVVPNSELDPDDTLAQILLHELLHHFVQGAQSATIPDWGLDNTSDVHVVNEHATLILQARLLDTFGLRYVLVPTTDFRAYYEVLPVPLHAAMASRAGALAEAGWSRLIRHAAYTALRDALGNIVKHCEPYQLLPVELTLC